MSTINNSPFRNKKNEIKKWKKSKWLQQNEEKFDFNFSLKYCKNWRNMSRKACLCIYYLNFFFCEKKYYYIVYHHPLIYFLTIIIYILYRNFSSIRVRNQVRIEFVNAWIVLFKYFFFGGKCLKLIFEIFEKKNEISVMIFLHALKL